MTGQNVEVGGVSRLVVAAAVIGTVVLALGAFWLSFTTLRDLARLAGIPPELSWVWPVIVDGVILEATISIVALRGGASGARRFAWLLLTAGAAVSVAANITHATVAADTRVPTLVASLVASVPPLVLLAMTHLTVELTKHQSVPAQIDTPARPTVVDTRPWLAPARAPVVTMPGRTKHKGQEVRDKAVAMHEAGRPKRQIAAELGVHPTTVGRWVAAPDGQPNGDHHD